MLSAILLAAGESRRMGAFKQLLNYGGKTFVECCVDNLLASRVAEIVVVTGHRDADVRRALGDRKVRFAFNVDYKEGMSSSLKRGVLSLSEDTEALLIALADQPQITSPIINRVISAYESMKPLIVVPTYDGHNGHPVIISTKLKADILRVDPQVGLRQVVHANKQGVVFAPVESQSVLMDFDYPEDYEKASKNG